MGSFCWVFGSSLALTAIAALAVGDFRAIPIALLWAVACFAAGSCLGFLFGIPRAAHSQPPHPDRQPVSTNLIEISDWLTKIIVGLGLINLKELPQLVGRLAEPLAASISGVASRESNSATAAAIVVAFVAMGFLFGYLFTRLHLASAFGQADAKANGGPRQTAPAAPGAMASLQESVAALADKVSHFVSAPSAEPASQPAHLAALPYEKQLLRLAKEYDDSPSNNREGQIRSRDDLTGRMAVLINTSPASRNWVAETALQERNVGLVAGLASAITAEPQSGDAERLLKVAMSVSIEHARYRVVSAIGRLFDARIASSSDIQDFLRVLDHYHRDQSDEPFKQRVAYTRAQISRA
jgi:hypothetical protein